MDVYRWRQLFGGAAMRETCGKLPLPAPPPNGISRRPGTVRMRGQWSNDYGTRLHYVVPPHPHHHPAGLPTNRSVTLPSVMCPQGTRPRRVRFCSHPPFSPSAEFRGGVADHRAATGETGKKRLAW
ncbi:unnamed protein product [Ectocarpus sp. 8 AP-2014]